MIAAGRRGSKTRARGVRLGASPTRHDLSVLLAQLDRLLERLRQKRLAGIARVDPAAAAWSTPKPSATSTWNGLAAVSTVEFNSCDCPLETGLA